MSFFIQRDELKKTVDEISRKRKRELDSNSRQASWFLQRLSSKYVKIPLYQCYKTVPLLFNRVAQVNGMIEKKGEAKKNSELQKVLAELGDKIEVWLGISNCLYTLCNDLHYSNLREERSVFCASRTNVIVHYNLVATKIYVGIVQIGWKEHVINVGKRLTTF